MGIKYFLDGVCPDCSASLNILEVCDSRTRGFLQNPNDNQCQLGKILTSCSRMSNDKDT